MSDSEAGEGEKKGGGVSKNEKDQVGAGGGGVRV